MQYNKDFLLKLDKQKNKKIFARITALTFEELPVEYIEGRVTQGSINLDGASAVRRTCSLTIVSQDFDYSDYSWGLNTKFKLEIGVENTIDESYPNIIWFNQGIYLITTFNTSRSSNNFSISISGKDKMALLNGEVGGFIESSVDFGTIEEEDSQGRWVIRKIPIPEIIRNAVHHYAGEPYHNIIINDLDTYGLELLEYRYDVPMYLYQVVGSNTYKNATLDGNIEVYYKTDDNGNPIYVPFQLLGLKKDGNDGYDYSDFMFDNLTDTLTGSLSPTEFQFKDNNDGTKYILTKVEYGQTAGYRTTDLTYAGDLIANVGESIMSVLDKIKNMLVEFEYFYDLDGRFVFQKKQSFISTMWSPTGTDKYEQQLNESLALATTHAYAFYEGELITAFNNNPNLLNLKNDYTIWGERTTISGAAVPVHMRYAIDIKPTYYKKIEVKSNNAEISDYNKKYNTRLAGQTSVEYTIANYDWREIIYQMALDYFKYAHCLSDFELRVAQANENYYPRGRTGYEQYYTDLQGFWRQLYNPFVIDDQTTLENKIASITINIKEKETEEKGLKANIENLSDCLAKIKEEEDVDENTKEANRIAEALINQYEFESEDVIKQLTNEEVLAMAIIQYDIILQEITDYKEEKAALELQYNNNLNYYTDNKKSNFGWNKAIDEAPETLNFWFDFLDGSGQLSKYNVKNIGARTKPINDTAIKSIYFRRTPSTVFVENINEENKLPGYKYIQIGKNNENMFSISAQGKSAKDKLDELLYQHSYCIESSTITTIPIYYLEPNTRVYLHDEETKLDGDYIVSKITIPLTYNGTMSLTATKAAENII